MDPSQLQTDTDNDARSLEGSSTVVETDAAAGNSADASAQSDKKKEPEDSKGVVDASGGAGGEPSAKPPFFKRLWQKFNIYLLIFILLVVVASAVLIVLVIQDSRNNAPKENTASQELSEEALTQLSGNTVTVGGPKQILNVASNAVFDGSVLVRNNLEIAGTVKVGGSVALPGVTVSGNSLFNQVETSDLTITGSANVQGAFTAKRGVTVSGNSTFDGRVSATQLTTNALQLNGDLILTSHLSVGGATPALSKGSALGSGGTASINGSDTAGSIAINTGNSPPAGCFATITFVKAFQNTPHVQVTPVGSAAGGIDYYINRSSTSLSICSASTPPAGQTFGYDYFIVE